MIDLTACPICARPSDQTRTILQIEQTYEGETFPTRLVECGCGHVFSNPQPTWRELAPFYGEASMYKASLDQAAFNARVDDWVARRYDGVRFNHVPVLKGGRYLDVGCDLGDMVAAMGRLGMDAQGVEPRAAAASFANEVGLKVFPGTLEEARFPDESFDRISLYHVLEHTPDPIAVLDECRRVLRPGGLLVIGVPNYDSMLYRIVGATWLGLDLPRHLHQFRPASIRRAAERARLEVDELITESITDHVEMELAKSLRKRALVPIRLTMATHATRPIAAAVARRGPVADRGESIVVHLRRVPS